MYFEEQMKKLLGARYDAFVRAFENKPRHKAARINTLKISVDGFISLAVDEPRRNALCAQSVYTDVKPSLDPLYHAGLYYMQEPSASAAVAAFSPFIGKRVLDLCAAPGGKATQAAAVMNGRGVIFCNDVEYKRVCALEENIVRLGITNAVVTCATASDYRAAGFDGYFDTLILDAPCSGGGMMRYETVPYSAEIVAGCAKRQREILDDASELLRCGGHLLYSTCTFSREENEANVEYLAAKGFAPVDVPLRAGEERGIGIPEARRIYPMNFDGEGHFYCVLEKTSDAPRSELAPEKQKLVTLDVGDTKIACALLGDDCIYKPVELPKLFRPSHGRPPLSYRTVGTPVYAGACAKNKSCTFSHALTHALSREEVDAFGAVELGKRAGEYIRGEQLDVCAPKGLRIATVNGFALGFVKSAADGSGAPVLKNLYPKALRI